MSTLAEVPPVKHKREVIDQAVIRFAGDSGDGMQVTGNQFTNTVALYGNGTGKAGLKHAPNPVAKLGAVREGVLRRDRLTWTGYIRDTVVFSIVDHEWPELKARLQARVASLIKADLTKL